MLRRILCFACVLLVAFIASSCLETVPWADPVQCEEAGCAAENRECTALNRFEVVCGKCVEGFEQRGGECLPIGVLQSCDDLDCDAQSRRCVAAPNADAQCGACVDGTIEENGVCRALTPCEQNIGICGEGNCVDAENDYRCECFEGYTFDGTACVDIDECELNANACGVNEECTNTSGSYECACSEGFELNGTTCVDVGPCSERDDVCAAREICFTTSLDTYECECPDGLLQTESGCQPRAVHIAAGEHFGCIIVEGGELYCWGTSFYGALGLGSAYTSGVPPTRVEGDQRWRIVETGFGHTCGITTDNDLYCWGASSLGQTGTGPQTSSLGTPHLVGGGHKWLTVSLGYSHTCGLTEDFDLYCWGQNRYGKVTGERYVPEIRYILSPVIVRPDLQWNNVVLGNSHSYGQTENGDLYAWGYNGDNHLGTEAPPVETSSPMTLITDAYTWAEIDGSNYTTCGISEGALYCWGVGNFGELGQGSVTIASEPTRVGNEVGWTQISMFNYTTCALRDGDAYCWGENWSSPAGAVSITTPTLVEGGHKWSHIRAGTRSACGISDGVAYCWGQARGGGSDPDQPAELLTPHPVQFFP